MLIVQDSGMNFIRANIPDKEINNIITQGRAVLMAAKILLLKWRRDLRGDSF
jgi:hypothetical protein